MGTFTGGSSDETYVGTADSDQATGGGGNDVLIGLGGYDTLEGQSGDDSLDGGDDGDTLIGGAGADTLTGGNGGDRLVSYVTDPVDYYMTSSLDMLADHDQLAGGAGDDFLYAGYGDSVDGGDSDYFGDTLYISFLGSPTGVTADFRGIENGGSVAIGGGTITNIEAVAYMEGSQFDDLLATTNYGFTSVYGAIYGRGGNDRIITGNFTGDIYGGDGNDNIDRSHSGGGASYGESGDDVITGSSADDVVDGGDGNDIINGFDQWDRLSGGAGNDVIDGGSNWDVVKGGAGNDTLYGGGDYDQLNGEEGDDLIYGDYSPLGTNNVLSPASNSDILSGDAGNDTLHGNEGMDRLDGGIGDDLLYGEDDGDTLIGGDGIDRIDGGVGDDTAYGGIGDDLLIAGAGLDQMSGEDGDDRIYFGAGFGDGDLAAGGAGTDALILQGEYSGGLKFAGTNAPGVERLSLLSGSDASYGAATGNSYSYDLTLADNLVPAGASFAVDGAGLGSQESLILDATAEANGRFTVTAGAGNDDVTGGGGADNFFLQNGGDDHAAGGGGGDGFFFGGALTAADSVNGGTGNDTVALQGNYAAGLTLAGITNVEFLSLLSGANTQFGEPGTNRFGYALTTVDANLAIGQTLTVQATGLLAAEALTFDGSAETNGNFRIFAGQGVDTLTGGAGNDGFFFGADGNLTAADRIDGGSGTDSLALRGNYALVLQDATVRNVEVLALLSGHTNEYGGAIAASGFDYDLTLAEGNVASGQILDVNGASLRSDESLRFDGRAEADGAFRIISGAGDDMLFGGSGNDTLYGGMGKDSLQGGPGADTYQYRSAAESTSTGYDAITGFDWHVDRIDAPGAAVRSVSQSAQGSLSTASFDADLTAGLDSVLGAGQAALFTANSGTLSGHVFAVIDVNGAAGYQAGQDLVIELVNPILPIDPTAGLIV